MKTVCFVVGARPNFVKSTPVIFALQEVGTPALLVHTGQHYDREMSDVFISELGKVGSTIVMWTHNLDEADRLCDRVAVFKTRLLAMDSPLNLRRKLFGRAVVFHLTQVKPAFIIALRQNAYVQDVETIENRLVVKLDDPELRNPELVQELVGLGAEIQFVGEKRQSLEDVYLQLIGDQVKP